MTSYDVHLERLVGSTPEAAFAAWVDPESRSRWYAPDPKWTAVAQSDLRVGGAWSVAFGPGPEPRYTESGVYTEVDPPRRVAYTCEFEGPNGERYTTQVAVSFTAQGDKTLVVVDDRGFPDEKTRDLHGNGWPGFLDAYERTLAAT